VARDLRDVLTELLPRLRRFGLALTGSVTDTEDLVQNTCERALQRARQLRDDRRLDAWVYGIMRNLWIDELRYRRLRRHEAIEDNAEMIGDDGQALAEGRITLAAVRRVMAGLAEEHRTVLMLVCVDGLSYREAAEVLEVPTGTVMSRLARARRQLHLRLGGSDGGEAPASGDSRIVRYPDRMRRC
jgi:RNA polymerase sigma-70 factor (ECF subfamily)